jgi:hypothetical protein
VEHYEKLYFYSVETVGKIALMVGALNPISLHVRNWENIGEWKLHLYMTGLSEIGPGKHLCCVIVIVSVTDLEGVWPPTPKFTY